MTVADLIHNLLELKQDADVWFVRHEADQLIYLVGELPNGTKGCCQLPTAINKKEIKTGE